jgi:hypothetical protein
MNEPLAGENQGRVRLLVKIIAYLAACVATLFYLGFGSFPLIYMFPLGLVAIFDLHLANDGGWGVFFGAWLVYIAHAYFYFRSKTTLQTAILYGALVIMLIADAAGCQKMVQVH